MCLECRAMGGMAANWWSARGDLWQKFATSW